jgi:hypothetical protein
VLGHRKDNTYSIEVHIVIEWGSDYTSMTPIDIMPYKLKTKENAKAKYIYCLFHRH